MYDAAELGHRGIRLATLAWTPVPHLHDHAGLVRHRVDAYRHRLLTLGQRVRQLGARAICVTQPSRAYKKVGGSILGVARLGHYDGAVMNGVDYYHMIQHFHRTTLEACREMDGLAIDLANEVEWDDQDFYDFAHNTPRGAEKIGRALYAALRRHEPVHRALTSQASGGAPASAGGLR
jgi:hypothetical protein